LRAGERFWVHNRRSLSLQESGARKEVLRDISAQVIANAASLASTHHQHWRDGSQKIAYELFKKGMKIVGAKRSTTISPHQVTLDSILRCTR